MFALIWIFTFVTLGTSFYNHKLYGSKGRYLALNPEVGKEEGRRVFKSCLRGHWPLPDGALWVGKQQGGGWRRTDPIMHTHTGCNRGYWEEKMARLWEGFYYWDV